MLIEKSDICKHRSISKSVRDDKINPYIEDAELLDLKPLLGNSFYYDILKHNYDTKYNNLMNPLEYTIDNNTYSHVGLKKVLSIFTNARYILFGSNTDTPFGYVSKNHQDSTPVSSTGKRDVYKKEQQIATQYFADIEFYLNNNKESYPLWKRGCSTKFNGGIRISKIS